MLGLVGLVGSTAHQLKSNARFGGQKFLSAFFNETSTGQSYMELNPIFQRIKDFRERGQSLRGYL